MNFFRLTRATTFILGGLALVSISVDSKGSVVLISDNFNRLADGDLLNGQLPDVNFLNSNIWVGETTNYLGNGTGGLSISSADSGSISLDLGAGFVASNPGIYELSLDITQPTVSASSWIGFGFAADAIPGEHLVTNKAAPWVLFRLNGDVNFYAGTGVSNQLTNASGFASAKASTGTTLHTLRLQLDTTGANWMLNGWIDDKQIDLNGTSTAGSTFTYTANPENIRYVQIATAYNGTGATGTVDNLVLTSTVPEPGAFMAMVGGVGVLGLFHRFRRH